MGSGRNEGAQIERVLDRSDLSDANRREAQEGINLLV